MIDRPRFYKPSLTPSNDGTSEYQYLDLIEDILTRGVFRPDRTGIGSYAIHGATMRFDLSDGTIPLLTTKRIPWKAVANELFWFLDGDTNIRRLLQNNVHIWSEWPHAHYVKTTGRSISLREFEENILKDVYFAKTWGDLGPVYGKQWRRWEGPDGKVYDQIRDLLEGIKSNPCSRRLLFHGWNVADLNKMALPPCHLLYQFFVAEGRLSCSLYQRSVDSALGLPFNVASASLLVHMIAQQCDLLPGELFWIGHDVHLYKNHVDPIQVQLKRVPKPFPKLLFRTKPTDLFSYTVEDIQVEAYCPDPTIRMEVAV